jgi:tRNA A37 N6-isopentenylltransferase MiaA
MSTPAFVLQLAEIAPHTKLQWHENDSQMTMTAIEVVAQFEQGIFPSRLST